MVNSVPDAALGFGLAGIVHDVLDGAALVEAAQVHLAVVALHGLEVSAVRELPQNPLVADVGLVAAVLGDEQGIVGKGTAQIGGEKFLGRV